MKCPHCGYETYNNEMECPYCGKNMFKKDNKERNEEVKEEEVNKSKVDNEETKKVDVTNIIVLLVMLILLAIPLYAAYTLIRENPVIIVVIICIIVIAITLWLSKRIKDIVVSVGRSVLDLGTSLNVVCSVLIIIIGFLQCTNDQGIEGYIWYYIGGAIIFFLVTLLADYTLYLLIDIRDSLKELAKKADKK